MKLAALLIAAAFLCTATPAAAADLQCGGRGPVVLVIHGGAWMTGSAAGVASDCRAIAGAGFHAVSLDYPLGDYEAARNYVRAAAVRYHAAAALGGSAGGTLALDLGARGLVGDVVAIEPVSDFVEFPSPALWPAPGVWRSLGMDDTITPDGFWQRLGLDTVGERRAASPLFRQTHAETLIAASPDDAVVPYDQALRYWRLHRWTTFLELDGRHGENHAWLLPALVWLRRERR